MAVAKPKSCTFGWANRMTSLGTDKVSETGISQVKSVSEASVATIYFLQNTRVILWVMSRKSPVSVYQTFMVFAWNGVKMRLLGVWKSKGEGENIGEEDEKDLTWS